MPSMIARLHCAACSRRARRGSSDGRARRARRGDDARLLAFDTSTEAMAVAVHRDAGLFSWNGEGGAAASAQLIPQIHRLLRAGRARLRRAARHRLRPRPGRLHRPAHRLRGGPGPGLRRGAAGAAGRQPAASSPRTRARASGAPAEPAPRRARRDGCAHGRGLCRRATAGRAAAGRCSTAPALYTLRGAARGLGATQPPRCVAGSALPAFGDRLHAGARAARRDGTDRAAALLRLAQQLWRDGAASMPPRRCRCTCATRWR